MNRRKFLSMIGVSVAAVPVVGKIAMEVEAAQPVAPIAPRVQTTGYIVDPGHTHPIWAGDIPAHSHTFTRWPDSMVRYREEITREYLRENTFTVSKRGE